MLSHFFLRITHLGAEWVLYVLVILSMVSITIIVERVLYFRRNAVNGKVLAAKLHELLSAGQLRQAWELVAESEAIENKVIAAGLTASQRGREACAEAMLSTKVRERMGVEARISVLGTIGSNAPFIGLLGTVLGIIRAAGDLAGSSAAGGNPNSVMSGVFEALVATAVGLFVAIPAVVAFNYFNRKVKGVMSQVDSLAHMVLSTIRAKPHSSAPVAAPAAGAPAAAVPAAAAPKPQKVS